MVAAAPCDGRTSVQGRRHCVDAPRRRGMTPRVLPMSVPGFSPLLGVAVGCRRSVVVSLTWPEYVSRLSECRGLGMSEHAGEPTAVQQHRSSSSADAARGRGRDQTCRRPTGVDGIEHDPLGVGD
jgi:hypothetical protein